MDTDGVTMQWNERTALLLGAEAVSCLEASRGMVVGVGGVGAYAVEALARAGVGELILVDSDVVALTNLNRQIPALHSTIGAPKVEVMRRRELDINPSCRVTALERFVDADSAGALLDELAPGFVIDAIDSVAPKVALIAGAYRRKLPMISSMGAGGRMDPSQIRYADIADTFHDGLARAVRQRLKAQGITSGVRTVFSTEQPRKSALTFTDGMPNKLTSYGTVMWIPAMFGMYLAAYAVRRITGVK